MINVFKKIKNEMSTPTTTLTKTLNILYSCKKQWTHDSELKRINRLFILNSSNTITQTFYNQSLKLNSHGNDRVFVKNENRPIISLRYHFL